MNFSIPRTVTCLANKTEWFKIYSIPIDEANYIIKNLEIAFAAGCQGSTYQTQVKVTKNGNQILPYPLTSYADGYMADNQKLVIYVNMKLKIKDILEIWYKNTDPFNQHTVSLTFDMVKEYTPTTAKKISSEIPKDYAQSEDTEEKYFELLNKKSKERLTPEDFRQTRSSQEYEVREG